MRQAFSPESTGNPFPLGATQADGGWNFSIYSQNEVLSLCLANQDAPNNIQEIPLDPIKNRTGSLYHIFIKTDATCLYYGYKVKGYENTILIDPYAKLLDTGNEFGNNFWGKKKLYAIATQDKSFDWEGDMPLQLPQEDLVVYEMHVRGFTRDPSSKVKHPGTFSGIIEKIPYLKQLGINSVELLPIQEFDESEYTRINPKTLENLYNYWGYSPLNFFAPMQRYASSKNPLDAVTEFKELVKALHKANIEVILDIVYNHSGEGNEHGKVLSWKGFSNNDYYIMGPNGEYMNYSGCGNTFNCNNPITQDLIIEALRHWAVEYHIDGFRFDLASILVRGCDGRLLAEPPLLERITHDPILKDRKLIAEPWDAAGMHQVGSFFQSAYGEQSHWNEWNDDYRNVVRRFIKGTQGYTGRFATKISGSEDIYGRSASPLNSVNFITCHDGFTLRDLVSYNQKHNQANGEDNRDGFDFNDSWNCGVEGETTQIDALRLRERQMKNFMLALTVSQGIPMVLMGDEYGHSKKGNNNTWCQDNQLNWFLWDALPKNESFMRFYESVIAFRHGNPLLKRKSFLKKDEVDWHGEIPFQPDWSAFSSFIAFTLKDKETHNDLYIAFNASANPVMATLPPAPFGYDWSWIVNTAESAPQDFISKETNMKVDDKKVKIISYSAIMLLAQNKK
jgi:isoamylase